MAQGSINNLMESTLTSLPGCPKDGDHLNQDGFLNSLIHCFPNIFISSLPLNCIICNNTIVFVDLGRF